MNYLNITGIVGNMYLIVNGLSEIEMARKDGANLNRLLEGRSESSEFG